MATFYYVSRYGDPLISPVEVERYTATSVWTRGRRHARVSMYEQYYETWDEAYAAVQERAELKLSESKEAYERAKVWAVNAKKLVRP